MSQLPDFVGSWSLVSFHARTADGTKIHPMGQDLAGRISYDAQGLMAVQIMRRDRGAFTTPDPLHMTPEEAREALGGFIAYYGTYDVDAEAETVTHTLEVASIPNWVGTEQVRMFRFQGDRLTLSTPPMVVGGVEVTNELEWRRH